MISSWQVEMVYLEINADELKNLDLVSKFN